jgi:hypothetical protein
MYNKFFVYNNEKHNHKQMHVYLLLSLYISYTYSANRRRDDIINTNNAFNNRFNPDITSIRIPIAMPLPNLDDMPTDIDRNDMSDVADADDAMDSAIQAVENTNLTVQAAVNAIATCKAEGVVDCEELKRLYNKTQEYINIAANSYQQATSMASKTIKISNKSKRLLKTLTCETEIKKHKPNVKLSDLAARMAQNAVSQAKIAATAVAQASAQCSVIVKIRCNECPKPTSNSIIAPPA